ncbi:MAG: AAA family ATPase [Deltaproteobacteria bacterium]|nr:AAA family ATPase [Deltaproteobacteria bacterium]
MACEEFFRLQDTPFRLAPDPDYYFPSDVHKEALQTLLYSINAGEGFVQISGEPGTGKTMLIRTLLRQLQNPVNIALIQNPSLSPDELLKVILDDLGHIDLLRGEQLPKEKMLRLFQDILFTQAKAGRRTIVIVDEAQQLPVDTLEELRLLSNLETEKEKLLQIILVGQIELEEKLDLPELKQLAQRITIRYRLMPLSRANTFAYIRHRLEVAGSKRQFFPAKVLEKIYQISGGVPRKINMICERAMMAAFVQGEEVVTKQHLSKAVASIRGNAPKRPLQRRMTMPANHPARLSTTGKIIISFLTVLLLLALAATYYPPGRDMAGRLFLQVTRQDHPQPSAAPASAAVKLEKPAVKPLTKSRPANTVPVSVVPASAAAVKITVVKPKPAPIPLTSYFLASPGMPLLGLNLRTGVLLLYLPGHKPSSISFAQGAEWPLNSGIFILHHESVVKSSLFSPDTFYMGDNRELAESLWQRLTMPGDITTLPLIAYEPSALKTAPDAADFKGISSLIAKWSTAWRQKDLSAFLRCYTRNFTSFTLQRAPISYNMADEHNRRALIFRKSGSIRLRLTPPTLVIDPLHPNMAVSIFGQSYKASDYSDYGIKVLYLRRRDKGRRHGDSDNKPPKWQIMAKFWLPAP